MTIWKFPLEVTDSQVIKIPEINRPLTVQSQDGTPCLWAVVDPDSPRTKIRVLTFGTGHPGVTAEMNYVATYQLRNGGLVFHVFVEWETK